MKTPFCNACRRLVMDRVVMFLLFNPHPSLHMSLSQKFANKVREQYAKDRYKTRKLSNEFCTSSWRDPCSLNIDVRVRQFGISNILILTCL